MIDTPFLNLDPLVALLFCSGLIVVVIIIQILIADVIRVVSKSAPYRTAKICVLSALSVLLTINAIAVVYLSVRHKAIDPFELTSLLNREWTTAACCAVVGYYTYLLRCRARMYYGLVEIGVGLTTTYISADINVPKDILFLLAGVYIVVRGLDNVEKGLEEIPLLHRWWKARFESHR